MRIHVLAALLVLAACKDPEPFDVARVKGSELLKKNDFGDLAKQFSEGPGADKGGELGTFSRGQMDPTLAEVVFRLKPGEVSAPVRTATGFHLLRVDELVASGHKPLEDVSDEIRETLYNGALESRFENWLSRDLRERHHVELLE